MATQRKYEIPDKRMSKSQLGTTLAEKSGPTLEEGLGCFEEYALPHEEARSLDVYGVDNRINKLLPVNREFTPGRASMILVKDNLGFYRWNKAGSFIIKLIFIFHRR
jgi:hypothetical protein